MEETTRSYSPFPPPIPPPPSSSSSSSCVRSGAATSFASPLSAVSAIELASSRSVAAAAANANSGATCQGDPAQQLLSQVTQEQQANRWTSNTSTLPPVPSAVSSAPSGVLVRQVSRFSVMQTSLDGDPMPSVTLSVGDPCASANGGGGSGQPSSHNQSRRQRGRSGRNREGSSSNGGGHSRARRQRSNMSAASASGTSRASTPDTPIVRSRRSAGKFCLKILFSFFFGRILSIVKFRDPLFFLILTIGLFSLFSRPSRVASPSLRSFFCYPTFLSFSRTPENNENKKFPWEKPGPLLFSNLFFLFLEKKQTKQSSPVLSSILRKKTMEMEWTREKRKKVEYRKTFLFSFKGCGLRNENAIAVWYVVSFRSKLASAPISFNRAVKF